MQPGTSLGPNEIAAPLGAGGTGDVYPAHDTRLGRDVAIKVLPTEFCSDPDRLRRFEQEASAVAALSHPNVLAVFDVGVGEALAASRAGASAAPSTPAGPALPYLVTELLEGESLCERLGGGAMPVRKAVEVAVQIPQGLAAAHEKGIVHRDLKPANVFVTKDGHVKILEFGLARLVAPRRAVEPAQASTVVEATEAGATLGTVGYMSPEQVRGQSVDHPTDIFSFGCVLHEMLSGERAFPGATSADAIAAVRERTTEPARGRRVRPERREIAMKSLSTRGLRCAALLLTLAGVAAADQTGEIRGTIADDSGGVLPGVLVTAMSPNLQGLRTAVSDAKGFFRLPLLPVGAYEVTFELQGFEKLTLAGNEVRLGYTASLAVSLKLAALAEAITVTAAPSLIDKTKSDTSYRLRGAELSRIPTQARTIAEVVALTPGVTGVRTDTVTGTDTGLPSFRGEGDNGNNWLVDGLSTKGVQRANSGVRVNYDAWDEVQVISDGFEPENGQATGGFINIVTRSGGNAFHGEAGTLIQDRRLRSPREPQLSAASLPETSISQYFADLGGPILKDKLWFFLSDNYFSTVDRTTQQTIGWLTIPAGERSVTTNNVFGKLTYTPRPNHTLSVSGTLDTSLNQSGGIGVPETYTTTTYRDTSYRLNYMGVLSENTLLTAAAGQNRRSLSFGIQSGDYGSPSYYWQDIAQTTNNAVYYGTPSERRTDLAVSANRMLELRRWGSHEFKAGVSYYSNGNTQKQGFTGRNADPFPGDGFDDGVQITWTAPGIPLGLWEIQNGQIEDSTKGFGFHVQDTVTLGRVTLMLGLRTDTQQVFNDAGEKLWSWGAGDFLQPRASLAVDLAGDGRTVLKVAYGQFAMPMATEILQFFNRAVVPALRVYTWAGPANPTDAQLKDPANWQFQFEQSSTATPEYVDPAVKPNKLERVLVGLERQLSAGWALKLRGVYSHASDLMEDVALYAPETPSGLKEVFTNFNLKRRDYRALEVELNGRVAEILTLDASYVWSRARGTVPGNSLEQEVWGSPHWWPNDTGAFGEHAKLPEGDPNKALYDSLFGGMGGVGNGDEGWYGYLPYSVDHDVKILASYLAPHGVQVSTSLEWLSGYHWEKKGWVEGVGCYCSFPEGRGGRTTPALTYVDVAAQKDVRLGQGLTLGLGVNVYNLFNSQRPVSYVKEDTAQFGQVWARQLPRWVQLKVGLKF